MRPAMRKYRTGHRMDERNIQKRRRRRKVGFVKRNMREKDNRGVLLYDKGRAFVLPDKKKRCKKWIFRSFQRYF